MSSSVLGQDALSVSSLSIDMVCFRCVSLSQVDVTLAGLIELKIAMMILCDPGTHLEGKK